MRNYLFILIACSIILGCTKLSLKSQEEIPREIVMSGGMKICATDDSEQICVIADGYTRRTIVFDGEKHSINLVPRNKRWHGKLGLTSPKQPRNIWKTQSGKVRVLATEAQINYKDTGSALERLPFYQRDGINVVYNDSGLLVMWRTTVFPDEKILDLSIFQIVINGKKPASLPGSRNDKVVVKNNSEENKKGSSD